MEGGITAANVKYPKVIQSHHRSPIPPIKSVVADIHRYDPDLKLIFHESVDQRAQIALFWNESKRLAALYTFPESHIYAEHETSAPDLTTALSPFDAEIEVDLRIYSYQPDEGFSSFQKRTSKMNSRIEGANIATLDSKHGPLKSWGFGTAINSDDNTKLTFFIGYDRSEKRWRTYEFRVQHADTRSRRNWEMQEFDLR